MPVTRTLWSCSFVGLMTLAWACGGSGGSDDGVNDSTHGGSGGSRSHADAAIGDGAIDGDGDGTKSGGAGGAHTHGDAGERTADGGDDSAGAGHAPHAGNAGHGGASGADGNGGASGKGSHGGTGGDTNTSDDAGPKDAGGDSGADPCPSHVMCNAACCAAGQVCKTATGSQIDVAWDTDIGGGDMHAVVGSTLRFAFDDSRHDVQSFPNQAAFAACNFTNATLLSDSSPYSWNASTAGDFYFGCSTVSSFGAHCLDDNMKLHVIVDAPTQACAAP